LGRLISLVLLALLVAGPAGAQDFKGAAEAYKRGDHHAARKGWRALADRGDAHSQFMLGALYAAGKGVPRDYVQAAEWYRKAARQGLAAAQNNLGFLYDRGLGVPQDDDQAVIWYLRAARQEHAQAQNNLGVMYGTGRGVPRNQFEALKWFRLSAAQGNPQAQHNIGFLRDNQQRAVAQAEPPSAGPEGAAQIVSISDESETQPGGDGAADQPDAAVAASLERSADQGVETKAEEPKLEAIVSKKAPSVLMLAPRKQGADPREANADGLAKSAEAKTVEGKTAAEETGEGKTAEAKAGLAKLKQAKAEIRAEAKGEAEGEAGARDEAAREPEMVKAAARTEGAGAGTAASGKAAALKAAALKAGAPKPEAQLPAAKAEPGQAALVEKPEAAAPDAAAKDKAAPPENRTAAQAAGQARARYRVQLGALKTGSEGKARMAARRLARAHASALGRLRVEAVRADLGKNGVYYRLRAGPIANLDEAKALCNALAARKQPCLVVHP
jgi:hypothetical protein